MEQIDAPKAEEYLVYCTSCRAVYSKPLDREPAARAACPTCGADGWIALALGCGPDPAAAPAA